MLTVSLITKLDPELVARMAQLEQHLLKGKSGRPLDMQLFRDCMRSGFLIGAWEEKTLAGMCYVFVQQTISRRVMILEELVVDPEFRGRGIATQLCIFLISLARIQDADCIEGMMPIGNEAARKVYLRSGFTFRKQNPFRLILKQF